MKKIKYLSFYNTPENKEKHIVSPAGVTKVDYVLSVLDALKRPTDVITASRSQVRSGNKEIVKTVNDFATLYIPADLKGGNWFANKLSTLIYRMRFVPYLRKHLRRDDVVIVYHSLVYMDEVRRLKKTIGFKLILEVEEIYGDVLGSQKIANREMDFFRCADAYIFPTELLNEKTNDQNKPYVITHGTYRAVPESEERIYHDDNRVHCVYAGTFDPRKGVFAAISAAEHLPENYHMHILGFGSPEETERVQEAVRATAEKTRARVTYDGCLSGELYTRFIQSCDIGLSTQNPHAAFNDTSFPSKVLTYMANGLRVVSISIPSVVHSDVGDMIYYYDDQTPEKIAEAILKIDLCEAYDSRRRIMELDRRFQNEFQNILQDLRG